MHNQIKSFTCKQGVFLLPIMIFYGVLFDCFPLIKKDLKKEEIPELIFLNTFFIAVPIFILWLEFRKPSNLRFQSNFWGTRQDGNNSYLIDLGFPLSLLGVVLINGLSGYQKHSKTMKYNSQSIIGDEILLGNSIEMPSDYLSNYYSILHIKRMYSVFEISVTNKYIDAVQGTFKLRMDPSDLAENQKLLRSRRTSSVEKEFAAAEINSTRVEHSYPETTNYTCSFAIKNYMQRKDFDHSRIFYTNLYLKTIHLTSNTQGLKQRLDEKIWLGLNENDADQMTGIVKKISNDLINKSGKNNLIFYKTNAVISYRTINSPPSIGSGNFGAVIGKALPSKKQVEMHLFITAGKDTNAFYYDKDAPLIIFDPETK